MAVVRTQVIPLGKHVSPDGIVEATPQRVRHWVDSFRQLKAEGVQFPVPWGHALSARPGADTFLRSRYNAGYIQDMEVGSNGGLVAVIDTPALQSDGQGNLIDPKAGTAIREVSAGIGDWTDGRGRTHRDIINHIALTPLPVVAGQSGFQALATGLAEGKTVGHFSDPSWGAEFPPPADQPGIVCLSTRTLTGTTRMATDDKKFPPKDEPDGDEAADSGGENEAPREMPEITDEEFDGTADDIMEADAAAVPGEEPPGEMPIANPDAELIASAKVALAHAGLNLPDLGGEPDLRQFVEHLVVAITALNSQSAAPQPASGPPPGNPPVTEQQPPMMMSTLTPREKAMAEQLEAVQRAKRARRIDALVARGLQPEVVNELRAKATQTRLSLTADHKPARAAVDRELTLLERVLPKVAPHLLRLATSPTEQPNPLKGEGTVEYNGERMTAAQAAEVAAMLELSTGKRGKIKAS